MIPIAKITVGLRRRTNLRGIATLAKSIEARGLIHPIVLRDGHQLVAGQRRLEACRKLGWKAIPARLIEKMSDEELRAVEIEENTEREALADYETSKARLAEIRQAEANLKAELLAKPTNKSGRGRPTEPTSRKAVASITGIPDVSQRRIERHVETAERFPFMQREGWRQHNVLEAAEKIESIPPNERPKLATLLDQPGVPPKKAIEIIGNLSEKAPAERLEIYRLAASTDSHERNQAMSKAIAQPPPPDPGLLLLLDAEDVLKRAAKACRTERFRGRLRALADGAAKIARAFEAHHKAIREEAS